MEKRLSNLFPESPGLYLVQRDTDIFVVKIVGMYPCLEISRGFRIDTMITGSRLEEAPDGALIDLKLCPTKWTWQKLSVDFNVFPKTAFDYGLHHVEGEEYYIIREYYYRLVHMGISYSKILKFLVYEYHLSMDEAIDLVNKFDKDTVNNVDDNANT